MIEARVIDNTIAYIDKREAELERLRLIAFRALATRNAIIEECARELEIRGRDDLAAAIRALKDKP